MGAVIRFRHDERIDGLVACVFAAVAMAGPYALFAGPIAPRFLLPFFALLVVPGATLLVEVGALMFRRSATLTVLLALALIVPTYSWQGARSLTISAQQTVQRAATPLLGASIRTYAGDRSCVFLAPFGAAEMSVFSRCETRAVLCPDELVRFRREHFAILAVAPESKSLNKAFANWTFVRPLVVLGHRWRLYELRTGDRYRAPADSPQCER
jgi:hypothetical protein